MTLEDMTKTYVPNVTADVSTLAMGFDDEFIKAMVEFRKQWAEALAPLQALAGQYHAVFEALKPTFTQANIAASLQKLESALDAVDDAGWTIPGWLPMPEFMVLGGKQPEEVNTYLSNSLAENDFEMLQKLESELLQQQSLNHWHPLVKDIVASIRAGHYLVAIPAAISIIEGYIADYLVKASLLPAKTTSPVGKFLKKQWYHNPDYDVFFWKSGARFLDNLFANSDFEKAEPTFINRHWVLHGRSAVAWTQADALRLINAIDTLCDLFSVHGLPKAALQALQPPTNPTP